MPLIKILNNGLSDSDGGREIFYCYESFESKLLNLLKNPIGAFSKIKVETTEPILARDIAVSALNVLEDLNRFYKAKTVNEKVNFISSGSNW